MKLDKYVRQLKEKDETAFEIVYYETKRAVFSIILPIVKDRSLAEDVMQDTYIKMWERIDSYQDSYKFISWLLTIAKHTAIDRLRQRSKETAVDLGSDEYMVADTKSSSEQQLEAEELLSILTEEEKQIVLMKLIGNLRHNEIAVILNKPIGTIRWMYSESIKKMKKARKEADYE